MNRRDAILNGTLQAQRLHRDLKVENIVKEQTYGPIEVFGAIGSVGATVMFRPLKALLGACLSVPAPGVVISTNRPLPIQRFTAAHELGHVVMHHEGSLDGDEILGDDTLGEAQEIEANAFATEFMMPRWLLAFHASRQKWDRQSLADPVIVYQLSLRIAASYEATCFSLQHHKLITGSVLSDLRSIAPKDIKSLSEK